MRIRKINGQSYNGRSIAATFTAKHAWLLDNRVKEFLRRNGQFKTLAATAVTCFTGRSPGGSGSYVM